MHRPTVDELYTLAAIRHSRRHFQRQYGCVRSDKSTRDVSEASSLHAVIALP